MFRKAMDGIVSLCKILEADCKFRTSKDGIKDVKGVVKDPEVAKSKGASKIAKTVHGKGRHCTCCKRTGHKKRKCPERMTRKNPRAENNCVDPSQTEARGGEGITLACKRRKTVDVVDL
ncbi:hypothetical protein Ahy_B08g091531 [Arachis hypogaea]|uniref:CCHC-type domain-containing protein n=1 Tax=Arachis hypogaea TaxID=3818 RepID=A0A444Y283_ARAHY|nr:hypothetical protein Ahy_B08g091531 [Arachis hypogaea]